MLFTATYEEHSDKDSKLFSFLEEISQISQSVDPSCEKLDPNQIYLSMKQEVHTKEFTMPMLSEPPQD
jgi:hypothetical protein